MISWAWFPVVVLLLAAATGQEPTTRDEIRPHVSTAKQRPVDPIRLSRQLQLLRPLVRQNLPGRIITTAERKRKKRQLANLGINFPRPFSPLNDRNTFPFLETTSGAGLGASIVSQIPPQPRQIITTRITETSPPDNHVTIVTPSVIESQRRVHDFDGSFHRSRSLYHKHKHHHRNKHHHHHDHRRVNEHHHHHTHKETENHHHHHKEDHKHHHGHGHKHREEHHQHHEDHNHHRTLERHDHGHYRNFAHHFESSPVHEEYAFPEESAAIFVTLSAQDVLKIMQPPEIRGFAKHVQVV